MAGTLQYTPQFPTRPEVRPCLHSSRTPLHVPCIEGATGEYNFKGDGSNTNEKDNDGKEHLMKQLAQNAYSGRRCVCVCVHGYSLLQTAAAWLPKFSLCAMLLVSMRLVNCHVPLHVLVWHSIQLSEGLIQQGHMYSPSCFILPHPFATFISQVLCLLFFTCTMLALSEAKAGK